MYFLVIVIVLLLLLIILNQYHREDYCVFAIMSIYWIFFIVGSILLYTGYDWDFGVHIYILLSCCAVGIGETLGKKIVFNARKARNGFVEYDYRNAWKWVVLVLLVGMAYPIYKLFTNGFSLKALFNLTSFYDMNIYFETQRYEMSVETGILEQIFLSFSYLAPLVGGYMLIYSKNNKTTILCFMMIIPQLITTLSTNGKTGVVCSTILFISGLIVSAISRDRKLKRLTAKHWLIIGCSFLLFLVVMAITFFARKKGITAESIQYMKDDMVVYGFGHMQALDLWFKGENFFKIDHTLGYYTFAGIARYVFGSSFNVGVYGFIPGAESNIFTVYRGLIYDYGLTGGLIFHVFFGIISGASMNTIKRYNGRMGRVLLAASLFFVLYSFVLSAWSFNSLTLCFGLFFVFLCVIDKRGVLYEA